MWKPHLILALCAGCGPSSPPLDHEAVLIEVAHYDGPQPELIIADYDHEEVHFELRNDTEREFFYLTYGSDEPWPTRHAKRGDEWEIDTFFCGTGLEYKSIPPGSVVKGSTRFGDATESAIRFTLLLSVTPESGWVELKDGDPLAPFQVDSGVLLRKSK